MKYLVLFLVGFVLLSCISQNKSTSQKDATIATLVKTGQPIVIKGKIFEDEIDFTTYVRKQFVGINIDQAEINSPITFVECVFNQPVVAYHNSDEGTVLTHFKSNVSFVGCKFNNDINFRGSTFLGRVDFLSLIHI